MVLEAEADTLAPDLIPIGCRPSTTLCKQEPEEKTYRLDDDTARVIDRGWGGGEREIGKHFASWLASPKDLLSEGTWARELKLVAELAFEISLRSVSTAMRRSRISNLRPKRT